MDTFRRITPIVATSMNEAQRQTPDQVDAQKRQKLKEAMEVAKERMKSSPAKAKVYAAKLKYLEAQVKTLDAYKALLKAKD
jgi:hypothetical protein